MSKNNFEFIIDEIVDDLGPVKSFWSPEKRTLLYLGGNFLIITVIMLFIGPFRSALVQEFSSLSYILETVLFFITVFSLAYTSFLSLVPGAIKKKNLKIGILLLMSLIAVFVFKNITTPHDQIHNIHRKYCYLEVLLLSFLPLVQFYYCLKKGVFSYRWLSYGLAVLSAGIIPAFLMHFMCQKDYSHIMMYHFIPLVLMIFPGLFLLRKTEK